MSSQGTYTLKLLVDDSAIRKLEDKMNKIMNGGAVSSSASGGGSTSGENPLKQLGKLGLIAAGIGTLVLMVKKILEKLIVASPALQAMLQILDTSITLILRPFGDFVAFLLKPILLIFLQKVALPFYKILDAPFIKAGAQAGENIASHPSGSAGGFMIGGLLGALVVPQIQQKLEEAGRILHGWWLTTMDWFNKLSIPEEISKIWDSFIGFIGSLKIPEWIVEIWNGLVAWFSTLAIPEWMLEIWDGVVNFFGNLTIPEWMLNIWNGVVGFFDSIKIPEWLMDIWNGITNFFATLTIPEWLLNIWYGVTNFFATLKIPQWVIDIVDGFFAFLKAIGDWLAQIPDFLKNLLGLGGNTKQSGGGTSQPAKLEININGAMAGAGQFGNDVKNQVMGWFNEWLK